MCVLLEGDEHKTFNTLKQAMGYIAEKLRSSAYEMKAVAYESVRGKKLPVSFDIAT